MSIPMTLPETSWRPGVIEATRAAIAVYVAVALLRCLPLRAVLTTARVLKALAWRHGTRATVNRAIDARNWATGWFPGRATCLDQSLAAFLICAFAAIRVDWCIGCRLAPCESHAWIEHDRRPVAEEFRFDSPFHVTIRI